MTPLFTTERLRVRQLADSDLDAMHAVYGDADAMRWVGDGQPLAREGCIEWLAVTRRNLATRGYGMCAIELRAGGEVIGFCGLVHPGGQPQAEIKYALRREHWGRGYATEAARGLLAHGRDVLGLHEVIATAAPDNTASHAVLLKAGLQRGALRRNDDGSFTQLFIWQGVPGSPPPPAPTLSLDESFGGPTLAPALRWFNEPGQWSLLPAPGGLRIATDAGTDFWQRTHYGFEVDNGHFLYLQARGDFVLSTRVSFRPRHQYDQAGLMLRLSPSCWLKTSVEFEPDQPTSRLGAVVTNHRYSDWSTQPLGHEVTTLWFKLRVEGSDCIVQSSFDGLAWQQLRIAHLAELDPARPVACGLYACSPKAAGFEADFHALRLSPGREP